MKNTGKIWHSNLLSRKLERTVNIGELRGCYGLVLSGVQTEYFNNSNAWLFMFL